MYMPESPCCIPETQLVPTESHLSEYQKSLYKPNMVNISASKVNSTEPEKEREILDHIPETQFPVDQLTDNVFLNQESILESKTFRGFSPKTRLLESSRVIETTMPEDRMQNTTEGIDKHIFKSNEINPSLPSNMGEVIFVSNSHHETSAQVPHLERFSWLKVRIKGKWYVAELVKEDELTVLLRWNGRGSEECVSKKEYLKNYTPLKLKAEGHFEQYKAQFREGYAWSTVTVLQEFEEGFLLLGWKGTDKEEVHHSRNVRELPDEEQHEIEETPINNTEETTPKKTPRILGDALSSCFPDQTMTNLSSKNVCRQLFDNPDLEELLPQMGDIVETVLLDPQRFSEEKRIDREKTPKKSKVDLRKKSSLVEIKGTTKRRNRDDSRLDKNVFIAEILVRVPIQGQQQLSYALKGSGILKEFEKSELICDKNLTPIIIKRTETPTVYVLIDDTEE